MSIYWGFIYLEGELSPPAMLIVLMLALVGVLMQWTRKFTYRSAIIAGVLLGLCALASPSMLVLPPVILLWGWCVARRRNEQKRYVLRGLALALVTAATVAPATIRNYVAARDFVLISCNDGLPLYCANNEMADVVNPNFPGMENLTGRAAWGWFTYPWIVRGVEREQGRSMKYSEVSAYFTKKALAYMRQHPRRVLSLIATKAALFWGPVEVTDNKVIHYDRQNSAVLRYSPGFSVYLALCILGVCLAFSDLRAARKGKDAAVPQVTRQIQICVLIFVFVVTYFVSFLPFMASARHRVPIIPFVLLFAAFAIYRFGQSIRKRDWRIVAACGFIGAASYFYVSRPLPAYLPSRAQWHGIRAAAYHNSERLDRAIAEYREAIRLRPDFFLAHLNLATALSKQNRFSEMILPARRAVQLNPGSADAHFILGVALTKTVHIDEGIEYFINAAKLAPDYFDAHLNLGVAWAKKGKFDKAVECFEHARDLQPDNPIVHRMLAKSLEAQGRTERAISELREVLRLKPGDPEAREILRNLTKRQKLEK
jgi:tetratricopeptide (TPR) repeat protein